MKEEGGGGGGYDHGRGGRKNGGCKVVGKKRPERKRLREETKIGC